MEPDETSPKPAPPVRRTVVSIKDIAKESNVSLATVSLVLNRREARIRETTRRRVLDAAERLGYLPNRLAQALQSRRAQMLGVLVPDLSHAFADAYFGEAISAIYDCASSRGYKILLEVAKQEFVAKRGHLELIDRCFVDGALFLGATDSDVYLRDFADHQRPAIIVNNYIPGMDLNSICYKYATAGELACRHLLEAGHREIGLIHGARNVQTSRDFRGGVEAALAAAGLVLPEKRMSDGRFSENGGAEAAGALLRADPKLTALICGNDKMAIGAITRLKAFGKRVPDDVSIIGCDDIPLCEYTDPPLSTIRTPIYEIGRIACERLIDVIEGRAIRVVEMHDVSLASRRSVAAPPIG